MLKRLIFILAGVMFASALSGCENVTFPKEQVVKNVIDMCMKEYKVKVKAKIVGNTFGIYLPLGSLLSSSMNFKEDALAILQDVSTSVRRVALSTNANFEFYTVIGADRSTNIDFVMTHNTLDLRQVMLGSISRNDYVQRMILKIKYDMQAFGEKRIKEFFGDLATGKIEKIIGGNFYPGVSLKDISSAFFLSLLELSMKTNIEFKVITLKSLPITEDDTLFYVKAKETYQPKEGYSAANFTAPSGYEHIYLFVVTGKNYIVGIKKVFPLNSIDTVDKTKIKFPKEYEPYEDVSSWDDINFYIADMTLPTFVADQIAQRIKNKMNEDKSGPNGKARVTLESVDGEYVVMNEGAKGKKDLELVLKVKDKGALMSDMTRAAHKQFLNITIRTFKDVCSTYKFKDFKKISVFNSENKLIFSIDKAMLKAP